MAHEELAVRTVDGVTLRLDHVPAVLPRRGVVLCLHAMMTDGRYFGARQEGSLATVLAAAGIDVFVADFRGHGHSIPPRAGPDDWSFDDLAELDLPAMIAAVCEAAQIAPSELAILGHSLGGLVAAAALGTGRIPKPRALLLAATTVWLLGPGGPLPRRALMATYRGITSLVGRAPIRALRIGNADEAATYIGQLTGWARSGRWTSRGGIDYLAGLATIDTRTHAIAGAGDWMCRPSDAEGFAGRIPTCGGIRIVGRRSGDALDPDHFQLFTRPELAPLWSELADHVAG